jgi:hypothetical protein
MSHHEHSGKLEEKKHRQRPNIVNQRYKETTGGSDPEKMNSFLNGVAQK